MRKKQYLCSGFNNRHNLFCTLKIKQTNTLEKKPAGDGFFHGIT